MMLMGRNEANGGVKSVGGSRRSGTEELLTCDGRVRGRNEILREERGEEKRKEEKRRGEEQGSQLGAFQFSFARVSLPVQW
jgi:hypothetical protein